MNEANAVSGRNANLSIYGVMTAFASFIDRDSPFTLALVFSRIASAGHAGVLQGAVQKELGLTPASMTRALATLSDLHYTKKKPGLGLISRSMDFQNDGRQHLLKLTEKGKILAGKSATAIQ